MKHHSDEYRPRDPLPLFDWDPNEHARASDPDTSHVSARATATQVAGQCAVMFALIVAEPGRIADYYVKKSGIRDGWKRVSDLIHQQGVAEYRGTAINPETNRPCGRVWPVQVRG